MVLMSGWYAVPPATVARHSFPWVAGAGSKRRPDLVLPQLPESADATCSMFHSIIPT
jgi:hypothetical protein